MWLPQIYPLTDLTLSGLSHAEQVDRLCRGGAELIQIREKNLPPADFFRAALEAVRVGRQWHCPIIINDRVDIAIAVGADGVHLGQDDLPPHAARSLLGKDAIIGFSTHNVGQARLALKEPIDYLAIGPIFGTSTKFDVAPAVGLQGLRQVRDAVGTKPIVAIGGITASNLTEVLEAGASSVALVGAVLAEPQRITETCRHLIELAAQAA